MAVFLRSDAHCGEVENHSFRGTRICAIYTNNHGRQKMTRVGNSQARGFTVGYMTKSVRIARANGAIEADRQVFICGMLVAVIAGLAILGFCLLCLRVSGNPVVLP